MVTKMIVCESFCTYEDMVEFNNFNSLKKKRNEIWDSRILMILFFAVIAGFSIKFTGNSILTGVFIALALMSVFVVFLMKKGLKNSYKEQSCLYTGPSRVIFDEVGIATHYAGDALTENMAIKYGFLPFAYETEDRFYVYKTQSAAFIIKKTDIVQGTPQELSSLLAYSLQNRFHRV